jgi:hypothetical protein
MTNDINKVKGYAHRLEEIIEAADIHPHQRILVNSLICEAKKKFDMYETNDG